MQGPRWTVRLQANANDSSAKSMTAGNALDAYAYAAARGAEESPLPAARLRFQSMVINSLRVVFRSDRAIVAANGDSPQRMESSETMMEVVNDDARLLVGGLVVIDLERRLWASPLDYGA
jgi:hypothetical protein